MIFFVANKDKNINNDLQEACMVITKLAILTALMDFPELLVQFKL